MTAKSTQKLSFESKKEIASFNEVTCYFIGSDIFYTFFNPDSSNTSEEMEFVFNLYDQQVKEKKRLFKVLVEFGEYVQLDKTARDYLENHTSKAICEAVVTKNIAQRIVVNFYFKVKKHPNPSRAFKSKEAALEWINTF